MAAAMPTAAIPAMTVCARTYRRAFFTLCFAMALNEARNVFPVSSTPNSFAAAMNFSF
jgi:hypothetical protein